MPEKRTRKRTRKATTAKRLAARALGQPEPDVIELPTRTAAEQHHDRLRAREGWRQMEGDQPPPAA
ncbi:hypothetical protein GCM10009837_23350 [Streptomyces durmitorensis]|uniref:Uncharacterized protein n=1 Tax=Streptomyces durmitorensis TaxID=319947 RepID=A0ABY4PPT1_9ACTN|nr:hypothetical protein [Streptomyces durmitorensis]UQT55041.1 hypothetical protein M4V62_08000 [Streptomyces durmitorensis]